MATTTSLMTFAQFEQMPDDGRRYELRHGEPIEVPPPITDIRFLNGSCSGFSTKLWGATAR